MAIIDDIKCPRCDRKYSGVRSRCPYCGARRVGFGKYSKNNDNSKGKMLISILILAVFTVAAGAMLLSTPEEVVPTPTPTPMSLEDDVLGLPTIETPTPPPTPEDTPTPKPEVQQIAVLYGGRPLPFGKEFSQKAGSTDDSFSVAVEPPGVEVEVFIESEDEEIFTIERVFGGFPNGFEVTGVSAGTSYLLVTAGEKTERIKVIITG